VHVEVGQYLSVRRAEEILMTPLEKGEITEIDFSNCRAVQLGAAWRLGSIFRRFVENGGLHVSVPPPGNFTSSWFTTFTRSGLGQLIATRASSIVSPDGDVTEAVRAHYDLPVREARNAIALSGIGTIEKYATDDFPKHFAGWLKQTNIGAELGIGERGDPDTGSENFKALCSLCLEGMQNVVDHSSKKPLTTEMAIDANFSVRYFNSAEPGASPGPGTEFLEIMINSHDESRMRGLIEIVIADDGVGMAARQALWSDLYTESFPEERSILEQALATGGTVKLRSRDSEFRGKVPGLGTRFIADALASLHGFLGLRTGRALVTCDGSRGEASEYVINDSPQSMILGTVLQVVIPLYENQLTLPLT
jgi:hypothetical protein